MTRFQAEPVGGTIRRPVRPTDQPARRTAGSAPGFCQVPARSIACDPGGEYVRRAGRNPPEGRTSGPSVGRVTGIVLPPARRRRFAWMCRQMMGWPWWPGGRGAARLAGEVAPNRTCPVASHRTPEALCFPEEAKAGVFRSVRRRDQGPGFPQRPGNTAESRAGRALGREAGPSVLYHH